MDKYHTFFDPYSGQIRFIFRYKILTLYANGSFYELKMTLPLEQVLVYYRDQDHICPWIEL
jgi:hypothetical protein